jgi:flagellin-like protein
MEVNIMKNHHRGLSIALNKPVKYKKNTDERGVSPVIAVILLVAITVVLVSMLYVMVNNLVTTQEFTPRGVLHFTADDSIIGKYNGEFQGNIKLNLIEVTAFDVSEDKIAIFSPFTETSASVPGGINITYEDINNNEKLDGIDRFVIEGGEVGDIITITYTPTGEACGKDSLR